MRATRVALGTGALTLLASLVPAVFVLAKVGGSLALDVAETAVSHGDASTTVTLALAIAAPVLLLTGLALRHRGRVVYTAGAAALVVLLATTTARLPNLITAPIAAYAITTSLLALISLAATWWPDETARRP
jgi:hypothetical protein